MADGKAWQIRALASSFLLRSAQGAGSHDATLTVARTGTPPLKATARVQCKSRCDSCMSLSSMRSLEATTYKPTRAGKPTRLGAVIRDSLSLVCYFEVRPAITRLGIQCAPDLPVAMLYAVIACCATFGALPAGSGPLRTLSVDRLCRLVNGVALKSAL